MMVAVTLVMSGTSMFLGAPGTVGIDVILQLRVLFQKCIYNSTKKVTMCWEFYNEPKSNGI